jgi:hypothetical protein
MGEADAGEEVARQRIKMSAKGRYCCKSRKSINPKNLAEADFLDFPLLRRLSAPLGMSVVDFG